MRKSNQRLENPPWRRRFAGAHIRDFRKVAAGAWPRDPGGWREAQGLGAAVWALLLGQPSLPCREPVTAARGPKHPWPCLLPAPGGNTFAWMGECTLPLGYGRKWPPPIPREFHRVWKHLCGFIWTEKVLAQLHISRLKSDLGQAVSGACLFVQELKVSSDGKRRDFSC